MNEKEIEEIEEELDEIKDPWFKGPIRIILSVFLLLIILSWTYSFYGAALDPEPKYVPRIEEVVPNGLEQVNKTYRNYNDAIKSRDVMIKQTADKVISLSCEGNQICQVKAMYYFVRDNLQYVRDPVNFEYVEDPKTILSIKTSDCESGTILLASLLGAIGIRYEVVVIPNHALLRAKIPDISNRYKINDYVYMDWTCKNCEFGEVSLKVRGNI